MPDATTGHFLLAMPFSKAQDAQRARANAGIPFDPQLAVMAHADLVGHHVNHTGRTLQTSTNARRGHRCRQPTEPTPTQQGTYGARA